MWDADPADTFPYTEGEAAQGTSGVVDAVTNGKNTIGYADASRAGKLGVAALKVGDEFVKLQRAGRGGGRRRSPRWLAGRSASDIAIELDRKTTDPTHYPLVLVSYMIACQTVSGAASRRPGQGILGYVASAEGQSEAATSAGCAAVRRAGRQGEGRHRHHQVIRLPGHVIATADAARQTEPDPRRQDTTRVQREAQ